MKVVIAGTSRLAEVATVYLKDDPGCATRYDLVGYAVEEGYLSDSVGPQLDDLPVVLLEEAPSLLQAGLALNTIGYDHGMEDRVRVFEKILSLGMEPMTYISSWALSFSHSIGKGCFIFEQNCIQPFTRIGDNCVLWSGNHVGHHSRIGAHCFISSHVVISGNCRIGDQCFFGVNSSIRDGLFIAPQTTVGMGAVVTRDIEESGGTWAGNPAERIR